MKNIFLRFLIGFRLLWIPELSFDIISVWYPPIRSIFEWISYFLKGLLHITGIVLVVYSVINVIKFRETN